MRRSLRVRLLCVSLAVASLAVVATALLATYGTGTQLREQLESDASQLDTDSSIRDALLDHAREHRDWAGVAPLVRELAERTGRRIALTTPDGETIADSAELLGQGPAERPSTPAARVDAADPPEPIVTTAPDAGWRGDRGDDLPLQMVLAYSAWRLTEQEARQRRELADSATDCLAAEGVDADIVPDDEAGRRGAFPTDLLLGDAQFFAASDGDGSAIPLSRERLGSCLPEGLYTPSAAARAINERAVELATDCLDGRGLVYELGTDANGLRKVRPPVVDGRQAPRSAAWRACEEDAQIAALRPHVAPPADLYLGTSDRFAPFSPEGWWRTAATVAAVLLAAAVVTVLAGSRLVRPIRALTGAAQRMGSGDHTARVPVPPRGDDEVTRLAQAFNTMAASIESHDRERKALVSDVAHELRTPLANVRSHLEAAEDGVLPLDAELIGSLREEAALLERLVCDLQDLALADAGMLRIHPEERDAADLAGQAAAAHRARAESSGVALRVDAPADPVPVWADPARLRQALGNLVSNAVTHTPAGGRVEVAVRRSGDTVLLTVSDTGRGIAPEHLPHVFDRFYRADPSRSRATGGSGLGLAITRHLVEAHDGRVEARSTPGRGSEFTIRLPAPEGAEAAWEASPAPPDREPP
ncbi:ATP-binding protein [Streptomyces sp. B6B3]|uniref:ATP-binding protein n=1 Tax=Streptomyces sp. B6B3 TaxID=3153570 RepID=UPI00325C6449